MNFMNSMLCLVKKAAFGAMVLASLNAGAFSLLGPFKTDTTGGADAWQGRGFGARPWGLGYALDFSAGGPMFPMEAYRWNVPVVTYAFDWTFVNYFGPEGVAAVEQAIAMLNALPPASKMSASLSEYSLDTTAENGPAAALGLLDLKSLTLGALLEQMGLATPERYVWNLRSRDADAGNNFTNYTVIQMNYDPVTLQPSRWVNGVLYNYKIFDALGDTGSEWASAVEWFRLDPLYKEYSSVVSGGADFELGDDPNGLPVTGLSTLKPGWFYTGLTRDDVGGLRHLLNPNRYAFESLLPTVLPAGPGFGGSPWAPFIGTNTFGTNLAGISNIIGNIGTNATNLVRTALRAGVDKITFRRVSLFGTNFTPVTLRYTDRYINPANGRVVKQPVERLVVVPDIIFDVRDLGLIDNLIPATFSRSSATNWVNNAAINSFLGSSGLGGPGNIAPPIVMTFGNLAPYFQAPDPGGEDSDDFPSFQWGSFGDSGEPPIVFPVDHPVITLDYIRRQVLRTGNN